jgi:hypothetical protein
MTRVVVFKMSLQETNLKSRESKPEDLPNYKQIHAVSIMIQRGEDALRSLHVCAGVLKIYAKHVAPC